MSYDPSTGQWISQDPIEFDAGDPNLYRYVGNDPTDATDPSGLIDMPMTASGKAWIDPAEKQKILDGHLAYYSNFGWFDWNHAGGDDVASGFAKKVIDAVNQNRSTNQGLPFGFKPNLSSPQIVPDQDRVNLQNYNVIWLQDASGLLQTVLGIPVNAYAVKKNLSVSQKNSVALAIFEQYERDYEDAQASFGRKSAYSGEDLPSDLAQFYAALNGWKTADDIPQSILGTRLGTAGELKLMQEIGGTMSKYKNNQFDKVVDFNTKAMKYASDATKPAFASPAKFPANWGKVSAITPAPSGTLWFKLNAQPIQNVMPAPSMFDRRMMSR